MNFSLWQREVMSGTTLFPVHPSVRQLLSKGMRMRPRDMSTVKVERDQFEGLQRIAMEIFADCTNVGIPFQEAIAAVYLSGLEHGHTLTKERAS